MTRFFSALWHWFLAWGDWGFASVNHYLLVMVVVAFATSALLEWVARDPSRIMTRVVTAALLGFAWPITLMITSIALCATPFAVLGVGMWQWQKLHAQGREKAAEYIHERRERSRLLTAGDPRDWGKPTPESLNFVERFLRMEIFSR